MSELTQEQINEIRADGPQIVTDGSWQALCDMALRSLAPSATEPTVQDAQAIVSSCCALFDCRPSELREKVAELKGTSAVVEAGTMPCGLCGADVKLRPSIKQKPEEV